MTILKRDLNLLREILLKIESNNSCNPLCIGNFTNNEIECPNYSFHIHLLLDAGYIEAKKISYIGQQCDDFLITRLTNSGCDYIDAIRDDTVWNSTKEKLKSVGGSSALEIVKAIAIATTKNILGI